MSVTRAPLEMLTEDTVLSLNVQPRRQTAGARQPTKTQAEQAGPRPLQGWRKASGRLRHLSQTEKDAQGFSREEVTQEQDAESPSVSYVQEGFGESQQGVWRGARRHGLCLQVRPLRRIQRPCGIDSAYWAAMGSFRIGKGRSLWLPLTDTSLPFLMRASAFQPE